MTTEIDSDNVIKQVDNEFDEVKARNVYFVKDMLYVQLSDGREIGLPFKEIQWLQWLARATTEQRARWSIEPYGYAIWWEDLDDGFEVIHALSPKPLPRRQPDVATEMGHA
jgi:hypothetical protein